MTERQADYYLNLPYTIEVIRDDSGESAVWFAQVKELPGCMTEADTFTEVGEMIYDAMRSWIEVALERGQEVPEPRPTDEYSGKFIVRAPKSLHRELVESAKRDNISLNTYINIALGRAVGSIQTQDASNSAQPAFPSPAWPSISGPARRVLMAAGLEVEADSIDERLFSSWLEGILHQVQAALDGDYYADAIAHVDLMRQALRLCQEASPLMKVLHGIVGAWQQHLVEDDRMRRGYLQQVRIQARIRNEVNERSSAILMGQEERLQTKLPRHDLESVFSQLVSSKIDK